MPGISREEFIGRVREATSKAVAPHGGPFEAVEGEVGRAVSEGNPADIFAERAAAAAMSVVRVPSLAEAGPALAAILEQEGADTVHAWRTPEIEDIAASLPSTTFVWWDPAAPERKESAFGMKAGLTAVDYAVAETGSLVLCADESHGRSTSMLGEFHVAIVRAGQIVADLHDLYTRLPADYPDGLPSNISLVTGPSKTADIELQIVIGVHGPGVVHVILVDE